MGVLGGLLTASERALGLSPEHAGRNLVSAVLAPSCGVDLLYLEGPSAGRLPDHFHLDGQAAELWELSEALCRLRHGQGHGGTVVPMPCVP